MHCPRSSWVVWVAVLLVCILSGGKARAQKMKIEELLQRHLAAIGTAEARSAVKNRVVEGTERVTFRLGGSGSREGPGRVVSEASRISLAMEFNYPEYPGEHIVYDGKTVEEALIRPGIRSYLGQLIHDYDFLLKEGLLGGTTSTAWCLLDLSARQGRAQYLGLKKIDDKQLHEVNYKAHKGQVDFQVRLYFDPETYLHTLTTYELRYAPAIAMTRQETGGLKDELWELREEYGDYRPVDGLMLPHFYKLILSYEGRNPTLLIDWALTVAQVHHNVGIEPSEFEVRP
jgi:hypothetical protein